MPALRVLVIGNQILGDNKIAQELALRLPKDSQVEFSSGAAEAIEKTRQFKPNAVVLNFSMALTRIEGEMLISLLAKKMQINDKYLSALLNCKKRPPNAELRTRAALNDMLQEIRDNAAFEGY